MVGWATPTESLKDITMKYRRFGKTEINMPLISVGSMRFQTSWKRDDPVKPESITNLEKIVSHALDSGLNHFETAYGYGTSEQELGCVLPNYPRQSMIVQTKIDVTETVEQFLEKFEDSMKNLKVDYLDLLAVHGINNAQLLEIVLRKDGILDVCEKLKADGRVRHIGFASHAQPEIISDTIRTDRFEYVNLWHSYIYQFNTPPIEEAAKRDMGVFIISPNDKGGMLFNPPEKLSKLTSPLNPMTFNGIFILSDPNIHTISCGASIPENLDLHIEAVDKMDEYADLVKQITARLDNELKNIFDADWARDCYTALPDYTQTPSGMNIKTIVWLWNIVKAFDLTEYAKFRFNLMGNADHWFTGCKPQAYDTIDKNLLRDALKNSPYTDRIMDIIEHVHNTLTGEEVKRQIQD